EQLLVLESRARGLVGLDVVLRDPEVDALVEDARGFLVGERHDAAHEVATRHLVRAERDELIEQQHREATLLLLRFGRAGRHDRGDARGRRDADRRAGAGAPAAAATRAAGAAGAWRPFLSRLTVVGAPH